MLGFGPWGALCLNLFCWDVSTLVSDDSSTRMASLEVGNWILRGTREVATAGTLVAFGLDVSGLLLDLLLDELGSEGGEIPDILTQTRLNFCAQLQLMSDPTRALLSVPSKCKKEDNADQAAQYYPNQQCLRKLDIKIIKCKIEMN